MKTALSDRGDGLTQVRIQQNKQTFHKEAKVERDIVIPGYASV